MAEIPKSLARAAAERTLIFFIGAGFTRNIDPSLPTWSDIINQMANLLGYDPEILRLQGDYLQLAEFLDLTNRKAPLIAQLAQTLNNQTKFDIKNSEPHLLLPQIDTRSIYTTNWDHWIEKAFDHKGIPYDTISTAYDFAKPPAVSKNGVVHTKNMPRLFGRPAIVKFHGDFSHPDSIVISESEYFRRLDFDHPIDLRFRSEIVGCSVLFIGYSFSDPNVRYIWYKLAKSMKDAGLNVKSFFASHEQNSVQKRLFEARNIESVLLDPLDIKASVTDVFNQLIDIQK